jgi:hypothetical protein
MVNKCYGSSKVLHVAPVCPMHDEGEKGNCPFCKRINSEARAIDEGITIEPTLSNLLDSIAELCTVETRTKILCSSWDQANDFCNQLVNIDSTLNPKISTVNGHYSVTFIQSK